MSTKGTIGGGGHIGLLIDTPEVAYADIPCIIASMRCLRFGHPWMLSPYISYTSRS